VAVVLPTGRQKQVLQACDKALGCFFSSGQPIESTRMPDETET